MVDELLYFEKNVQIEEDNAFDKKTVTIAIELKEMLEVNDTVTLKLQVNGDDIKEIEIRRR